MNRDRPDHPTAPSSPALSATGRPSDSPDDVWAIVLAAGRGQRLARLTRALYGRDVPKQFAALDGDQSFLQQTMARAARIAPSKRTVVVVSEEYADLARLQLAAYEGVRIVEQPRDAGTLPGLLLPLAHVLAAASRARVVVFPSDHHVQRLGPFIEALRTALATVDRAPARTVLVGAEADRPSTDLGWILPGRAVADDAPAHAVERFVEKPGVATATHLLESGALWNTLLIALDGTVFWHSALSARPELAPAFERYRASLGAADEAPVRQEIYARLPALDLSRDLLSSQRGLAVVEMKDAGWSDCGTPERLFECLEVSGGLSWLLGRLATTSVGVGALSGQTSP